MMRPFETKIMQLQSYLQCQVILIKPFSRLLSRYKILHNGMSVADLEPPPPPFSARNLPSNVSDSKFLDPPLNVYLLTLFSCNCRFQPEHIELQKSSM